MEKVIGNTNYESDYLSLILLSDLDSLDSLDEFLNKVEEFNPKKEPITEYSFKLGEYVKS